MIPELSGDFLQWLRGFYTAVARGVRESHFDFGLTGLAVLPAEDDFDILLKARPLLIMRKSDASINNYHLMLHLVRAGLGVGIVDELCFRAAAYGTAWSDVATCTLDHLLPNVLYGILVRKNKFLSRRQGRSCVSCAGIFCALLRRPRSAGAGSCGKPEANTTKKGANPFGFAPFSRWQVFLPYEWTVSRGYCRKQP